MPRATYEEFAGAGLYLDQLDAELKECSAEPERGKDRAAIRESYWSKLARKHAADYTITGT